MARQKDTGWAWVCVLGSFYIHFIVFGLMQSFGVIYVELLDQFKSSRGETAWIGSLLSGLVLLLGPVGVVVLGLLGTRATAVLGAVLACVGCSVSFLADSLLFLYLSYGVLQGLGFSLLYMSAVVITNQYFEKRRSLANALGSVGGGLGTLVIPPLLQVMMSEYSWKGALLITGGLVLNCAVFGALFRPFYTRQELKYMKTQSRTSGDTRETARACSRAAFCFQVKSIFSTFTNIRYTVYVVGAVIGAFPYTIPFNHLPDLANDLDIPEEKSAWLISVIGIASLVGRLIFGRISDIPCVNRVAFFASASILCGAASMACPKLVSFPTLMAYSAFFGIFLGIWMYLQPVVVADIIGVDKLSEGFGLLICLEGVVVFLGSPFAGWLYDLTGDYAISFYVTGAWYIVGGSIILLYEVVHMCRRSESKHSYSPNTTTDHVYDNAGTLREEEL
ncbi:monocarboxylate transporter 14-like isoform X3 [Haliotis rufescens]|uniref:monocarboxylate transporter 14-like isoform X3 n=1 Tax=Haliotis rufescens TaxID=6454 RepID=UPI00201FA37A|nr:monocarboxylate transporter 14-like isoform X3 [Haliotis rufescens]